MLTRTLKRRKIITDKQVMSFSVTLFSYLYSIIEIKRWVIEVKNQNMNYNQFNMLSKHVS